MATSAARKVQGRSVGLGTIGPSDATGVAPARVLWSSPSRPGGTAAMARRLLLIHAGPALPGVARRHGDFDRLFTSALADLAAEWTVVRRFAARPARPAGLRRRAHDRQPRLGARPRTLDGGRRAVAARGGGVPHALPGRLLRPPAAGPRLRRAGGEEPARRRAGDLRGRADARGPRRSAVRRPGPRLLALESHEDLATDLPPRIRLLAGNAFAPVQAIAVGSARGVQFHPEFTPALVRDLAAELGLEPAPSSGRPRWGPACCAPSCRAWAAAAPESAARRRRLLD
jgi:hypothetical protein